MKVKELIKLLQKEDPNALVVCQRDPEGNGYSPLSSVEGGDNQGYAPESTWSGDRCFLKLTEELEESGYSEEDCNSEAKKAVFLVPVN